MEKFVHEQNLAHYRKLLTETALEPQRQQILMLLADEEAKDRPPSQGSVGSVGIGLI